MVDAFEEAIDTFTVSCNPMDLVRAFQLFDRFRALLVQVVGGFDAQQLYELDGATSMTAWLRTHARQSGATAGSFVNQARRLRSLPLTEAAALDGTLSADQVKVVLANVSERALPLFAVVEAELVPMLAELSMPDTVIVAREWAARAEAVVDADAEPREAAGGHLSQGPDGRWRLDAELSAEGGAVIDKAIKAAITVDVDGEPARTAAQRRADALVDVCRWFLDHREEPPATRNRPHLEVVQSATDYARGGPATLSAVTPIAAAVAARLACDCAVHRVLRTGRSHILDYGTATRLVSPALFRALVLRDRHCRFPGCDRPPDWCEAHHMRPVSARGPTCQENLALFCTRHHHVLHRPGWRVVMTPDGVLTVTTPFGRELVSVPLPLVGSLALPMPLPFAVGQP